MSEAKHTAEPWTCRQSKSDPHIWWTSAPETKENLERVVACVNALAGIPNPSDLRASHNRLVKALELKCLWVSYCHDAFKKAPEGTLEKCFALAKEIGWKQDGVGLGDFADATVQDALENARKVGG